MHSTETHEDVKRILRRININTWIFGSVALAVGWLIFQAVQLSGQQARNFKLGSDAYKQAVEARAKQDASDEQYIKYIKQTVDTWDKFQKDNPQIKVPKAPKPLPIGIPEPTAKELDRPKSEHPLADKTPAPIIKRVPGPVRYKKRPTPTPKPWYNFFKSTR